MPKGKRVTTPTRAELRVKAALRKRGHNYITLGQLMGISSVAVGQIVRGETTRRTSRMALAAALGMTAEQLWPRP